MRARDTNRQSRGNDMKQTIGFGDFVNAFLRMGRADNFSYVGLEVLFDHLNNLEDETGEEIELDVIALCCKYAEGTPEEIANDYDMDLDGVDEEDIPHAVMDFLCDNTTVAGETDEGTFVYQQF